LRAGRARRRGEALRTVGLAAEAEAGPPEGRLVTHGAPLGTELILIAAGPASDRAETCYRPDHGGGGKAR
jgi:hypothetical protein